MRTNTLHQQKPLFRFKDSPMSGEESKREMMDALEAVLDCYGDSDTLLMMQCKSALSKARRSNGSW
jgi:hypothetical protein